MVESQISFILSPRICPTSPLNLLGILSLCPHFQSNPSSRHPSYQRTFISNRENVCKSFLSFMLDPRLDLIHAHLICPFSYYNERNPLLPLKIEFHICPLYYFAFYLLKDLIVLNLFSWIFSHPFYAVFFPFIFKCSVVLV